LSGKVWEVYIVPAVESLTHLGCEVPVITIFTNFDGLVTSAYTELLDSVDDEKAEGQMIRLAQDKLEEDFKKLLMTTKSPPSDYVHLKRYASSYILHDSYNDYWGVVS
jgi:hypothetical protein